jgi:hypothetical protein
MPLRQHLRNLSHLVRIFTGTTEPREPAPYLDDTIQFVFPALPEWEARSAAHNPAAGANFSFTVPQGEEWLILSLVSILVTDATVSSRVFKVEAADSTGQVGARVVSPNTQAASVTWFYDFSPFFPFQAKAALQQHDMDPLPLCVLAGGWTLASAVDNLQAGDNIGNSVLFYLRRRVPRG